MKKSCKLNCHLIEIYSLNLTLITCYLGISENAIGDTYTGGVSWT